MPRPTCSWSENGVARLVATLLLVTTVFATQARAFQSSWTPNPANPIWCGLPQTHLNHGAPPQGSPIPTARLIEFSVTIAEGVHEGFDVEVVAAMGNHEFPAGTTDFIAKFFELHPDAHCAMSYGGLASGNDCDGDGVVTPGPGDPPCWGDQSATIEDLEPGLPKDLRSSAVCQPAPRFRMRVDGHPSFNAGVVGIRIRGWNEGAFLGACANSSDFLVSGHGWVRFYSHVRPQFRFTYGKYPVPDAQGRNQPFAPGMIRDDSQNPPKHIAWFPVTAAEFNAALQVLKSNMAPNPCSPFNLLTANCCDFMFEVMTAAGCEIPDPHMESPPVAAPREFNRKCQALLDSGTIALPRCGFVVRVGQLLGGPGAAESIDAAVAFDLMQVDPESLAAQLGFQFDELDAGACALRPNTPLTLAITGETDALLAIDYGDGTTEVGGPGTRTHVYAAPGSYELTVTALVQGEVRRYGVLVTVAKKAPNGAEHTVLVEEAAEPKFPPVDDHPTPPPFLRACPGDVDSSFATDGADLAIVLAEWGSVSVTMADINDDGIVDANDLAIVLADWGVCDPG